MENSTGIHREAAPELIVQQGIGREIAHAVSNIFSPPALGLIGILATAGTLGTLTAWSWALFFAAAAVGLPVAYIVVQLRRGAITDFHLRIREERFKPMLVLLGCLTAAIAVMTAGSAPAALTLTAVWGIFLSLFLLLVTLVWKISGHSTAATAFAIFIHSLLGSAVLPVFLLIPLVGWARLRIKRHTPTQVLAGTLTGILFTGSFLYLLRTFFPGVL